LGTKLGGVLLLRMHHKAMQLVLGRLARWPQDVANLRKKLKSFNQTWPQHSSQDGSTRANIGPT